MLRDMLKNLGVRFVEHVGTGSEAVASLHRGRYDVILCDYNLGPGKNGQQLLEEAKLLDLLSPTCIWLMVSAEKSVESVMGAAEFQPDGYLLKPITESVLLTRLNRIWSKKQVFKEISLSYEMKDYLKGIKLCDEKLKTEKIHALELMRMKATLQQKSGDLDGARGTYEQIMAAREFVWAKAEIAKIRLQNGEVEEAKQLFQEVLAENPNYLDAYDQLAATHQQLGELPEAEQVLQSAAKLSPNSVSRQKNLGNLSLKLGNIASAEKAFKKCIEVGEYSILRAPDPYLNLARVYGQKNEPKEALKLLATVQGKFDTEEVRVRAKTVEGLVYHESGDYVRARKTGDELGRLLETTTERPDPATCLDMARLLFAVGVKDAAQELLSQVVKNNHDNEQLAEEVLQIFEKARMGDAGAEIIAAARKEAVEMMNRGVTLWKETKYLEALEWMRSARKTLPTNIRILLNLGQILIAYMQKMGFQQELADEAYEVLSQVDKMIPNQRRFALLMEQLTALGMAKNAAEKA